MTPTSEPISVALVNDHPIVVEGLAALLGDDPRVRIVELDSKVLPWEQVDVVLYDAFAAQDRLVDELDELSRAAGGAKVVVFSWNVQPERIAAAFANGADGYLSKALDAEGIADGIVRVAEGASVVEPVPTRAAVDLMADWPGRDEGLSPRESEVIVLVTQGATNPEIAARCFLSINSVKSYIRSAYRKMGVERRSQAVRWGIEHGMLPEVARETDPNG